MNPGAGGVAAAGAGIGMGMAAGGAFNSLAQEMFAPVHSMAAPRPVTPTPSGRFRQQGATQTATPQQGDPVETLAKLKKLLDAGLIEQGEYDAKKAEVLSRM